MRKFVVILLSAMVSMCSLTPVTCRALDFDPNQLHLEYADAPADTAYIDILVQISQDDGAYTDFNIAPERLVRKDIVNGTTEYVYETLAVDSNSEIVQYCDDGYRSLSVHSDEVERLLIEQDLGYDADLMMLRCNAETLYEKYRDFRIAYVGAHGEVLAVTGKARRMYHASQPYGFAAEGERAVCRVFGISPLTVGVFITILLAALCLMIAAPVLLLKRRATIKTIKKIMNTDHT